MVVLYWKVWIIFLLLYFRRHFIAYVSDVFTYVQVCSTCSLRGSCDRAYVILKETEADARTVDIVRILLFYALDSLVLSGGEKPPGRQTIESSARKLLSELIELSETSPDPALPKPAVKALKQKDDSLDFMDDVPSQDVEMKRGDWMCPK